MNSIHLYIHLLALVFVLLKADLSQAAASYMTRFKVLGNEKIHIKADMLEVKDAVQKAFFKGNVFMTQEDFSLQADKMTIDYNNTNRDVSNKINRMDVERNIFIQSGEINVIASNGYVDFQKRILVLNGDRADKVILKEKLNTFLGCKLIVNIDTSFASLQGCESDQVQSIIRYDGRP
ncbi:LptA/OstA family protein [Candidatus Liberibacter asiaticus]|uniref:LptA/OstA family protein n=1 Tax=Liberibacter asiaticus TaxID=34021 RepID=UPI001F1A0495|nr:LptA/OstA family protein [Candidatus Liberibacter asiaticus]MDI1493871.1 LptA/OstA family protein [Candidatus Liberibacter asiaticus]WCM57829.1 OstA family protein [Candidatus Liberibacter asiaticus]WCM58851.1 OstA family protein [Candidatus Liberibacter asiaticus]WGV39211.1 LptA/OstA family protein [Candidatus Liberibacter asiaticus]WLD01815.1 LptA/OstA family protein [Candidatus Liberibacter asiaticus]